MSAGQIPTEAIEAAAKASPAWCGDCNVEISPNCPACARETLKHARQTLEAAAPFIAAQALRDAAEEVADAQAEAEEHWELAFDAPGIPRDRAERIEAGE